VHLQQYVVQDFQGIPTIELLFLLNVIGSGIVGVCLLAPLERMFPSRRADAAVALLSAVGLTIAIGSLVALFISENASLFGLRASRYSTAAVLAIIAEGAGVLFLTPVLTITAASALEPSGSARAGDPERPTRAAA
jgi:hypothetical protein